MTRSKVQGSVSVQSSQGFEWVVTPCGDQVEIDYQTTEDEFGHAKSLGRISIDMLSVDLVRMAMRVVRDGMVKRASEGDND